MNAEYSERQVRSENRLTNILLRRRRVLDLLSNIYDMIRAVLISTNVIK